MIRRLSDDEKTALLLRRRLGRLGCTVDGFPYVVPINYVFDGENIYSHSLPGTKIDALRMNPNACLQVDEISDEFHWQSVMAVGDYEEITSDDERDIVLIKLLARLPRLTPVENYLSRLPLQRVARFSTGRHGRISSPPSEMLWQICVASTGSRTNRRAKAKTDFVARKFASNDLTWSCELVMDTLYEPRKSNDHRRKNLL